MANALKLDGIALTVEQGKWRRLASQISRDVLTSNAVKNDQEGAFPEAGIAALRQSRLLALTVPTELGGPGENILTAALVIEELGRGCSSTAMCYAMHMSTVPLVAALVRDRADQIDRFLAPLIHGERLHSLAYPATVPNVIRGVFVATIAWVVASGNTLRAFDDLAAQNPDHLVDRVILRFPSNDRSLAPLATCVGVDARKKDLFIAIRSVITRRR